MITNGAPTPNRAPDPRPARTRAAIIAAVEHLGRQHQDLSVSQVVVQASLSRSSFYSQFNDIGDVAVQLIRELYSDADVPANGPTKLKQAVSHLLGEFQKRKHLYATVLGSNAAVSAEWEVCEIVAQAWQLILEPHLPADLKPEFAARYIASGVIACIVAWLRSEDEVPAADLESQLLLALPDWAE